MAGTSDDPMSRRATKSRAVRRDARSLTFFLSSVNDKKSEDPCVTNETAPRVFYPPPSFSPRVAATPSPPRHAGGERRQPTESNGNSFLGNSLPEIYGRNWPSHARSDQRAIHLLESVQPNCVSGQNKKEKGEGERGAGGRRGRDMRREPWRQRSENVSWKNEIS